MVSNSAIYLGDNLEDGDDEEEEEGCHPMEDNRKRPYNADEEAEEQDEEEEQEEPKNPPVANREKSGCKAGAGNKKGNGKRKGKDETGQIEPSMKRTRTRG